MPEGFISAFDHLRQADQLGGFLAVEPAFSLVSGQCANGYCAGGGQLGDAHELGQRVHCRRGDALADDLDPLQRAARI